MNPTSAVSITDNVISNAPEGTALVTLEGSGKQFRLHLSDMAGNDLGYLASASEKNLTPTESASDAGTEATISISGDKATISYGNAGYLKYNNSAKMWRTYKNGQEDLSLYRFIPKNKPTGVNDVPEEPFSIIISGNNIVAPEGTMIFDLNGRAVNGDNLDKGVYIVVSPQRTKTVKAMVGF